MKIDLEFFEFAKIKRKINRLNIALTDKMLSQDDDNYCGYQYRLIEAVKKLQEALFWFDFFEKGMKDMKKYYDSK